MSQLKGTALGEQNGRHEAEQLEMPLAESLQQDPLEFLLAEDPILELIHQAKSPLADLQKETHHDSIMALIEIEHAVISAKRIKAIEELETLLHGLKISVMRSLGRALVKTKEAKQRGYSSDQMRAFAVGKEPK